jgi:hypothetical protein
MDLFEGLEELKLLNMLKLTKEQELKHINNKITNLLTYISSICPHDKINSNLYYDGHKSHMIHTCDTCKCEIVKR